VTPVRKRLRVALPWTGVAPAGEDSGPERLPAAEWLLARAQRGSTDRPWREWLLADPPGDAGLLERFPAGPCLVAAWTKEAPAGRWAGAAPVHLLTALDHLRLAAPVPLPLEPAESAIVVADLNAQLAHRGFVLEEVAGRGWLCRCPDDLDCQAVEPALAIGGNLRELMPTGRDAARVRAWVNEAQMLLHEHPVNLRRGELGLPAVNSVWLWGFGSAGVVQRLSEGVLLTDDDWLTGLARLLGTDPGTPDGLAAALVGDSPTIRLGLAHAAPQGGASALAALERQVFAPVRAALASGALHEASFLLGTATFELTARARWQFWRRSRPLGEVLR